MAETKECIACAEEILEKAKLCKHCGTTQDSQEFQDQSAKLTTHVCNHESLSDFAKRYSSAFSGGPKLKDALSQHGAEPVVAVFPKAKLSAEGVVEQEMIFTADTLIFAGYGSFGRYEEFELSSVSAVWITGAEISMGFSDESAIVIEFDSDTEDIEPRIFMLGSSNKKIKETLERLFEQLDSLSAHVPVGNTGETIAGGYTFEYGVGIITN
jgi:hypothetical protein